MQRLTMDQARHFAGMPVFDCECNDCTSLVRERREQQEAAIVAIQKLTDAGIKFDQEMVRKAAEKCGVQWERN